MNNSRFDIFYSMTQAEYDGLTSISPENLYFISDTRRIYKGALLMATAEGGITEEELKKALFEKADQPYTNASGYPLELVDSISGYMKDFKIAGDMVRDGDTPTMDVPLPLKVVENPIVLRFADKDDNVKNSYTLNIGDCLAKYTTNYDRVEKGEDDKWRLIKKTGRIILDGTVSYTRYSEKDNTVLYQAKTSFTGGLNSNVYCSHFLASNVIWNVDLVRVGLGGGEGVYRRPEVRVNKTLYPTVESFQEWVGAQYNAGTPVTIIYTLLNPTETILDDEVQTEINRMMTLDGVTRVTIANNTPPSDISFGYRQDLQAFVKDVNLDVGQYLLDLDYRVTQLELGL